jgi:ribonuclease P protein component
VLVVHLTTTMPDVTTTPARARETDLPARAGFVVPKAVGGAVERNRVRRRLRHLVSDRLAMLPAGSRVVVRALPGAADREYSELAADLDGALARVAR